jgi:hypothetical protein
MLIPSYKRRVVTLKIARGIHWIVFFCRQIDVQFLRPKDGTTRLRFTKDFGLFGLQNKTKNMRCDQNKKDSIYLISFPVINKKLLK